MTQKTAAVPRIDGIHHVTAIASDPQQNLDFYVRFLGMRLVKRTVNFEIPYLPPLLRRRDRKSRHHPDILPVARRPAWKTRQRSGHRHGFCGSVRLTRRMDAAGAKVRLHCIASARSFRGEGSPDRRHGWARHRTDRSPAGGTIRSRTKATVRISPANPESAAFTALR